MTIANKQLTPDTSFLPNEGALQTQEMSGALLCRLRLALRLTKRSYKFWAAKERTKQ